ncbi:MAG: glycosyltransferase family 2 protein [Ignavibacteriae bacterium]|nr:glycosyltransferase family 2 protein [Ignavibacteriota bacterium]
MSERISVIIPTYNRKDLVVRCVESVLAQTLQPFEVIVVDDGSSDDTPPMLAARFGEKAKCIRLEHRGLPSIARNAGIDAAQGTHLAFCDSDDVWLPRKLEVQMSRLREHNCNCSCSDAFIDREGGDRYLSHFKFVGRTLLHDLFRENFIITSSILLERAVVGSARFNTSAKLRGYEDYDFWLRLARDLQIDYVPEPLLIYKRHGGGLSHELKHRDALQQIRILLTNPAFVRHPFIWGENLLRSLYHLAR